MTTSGSLSISHEQHHTYRITIRGVRKMATSAGSTATKGSTGLSVHSGSNSTTHSAATDTTAKSSTHLM